MLATATVAAHSINEKCFSIASEIHQLVQNVQASRLSANLRTLFGNLVQFRNLVLAKSPAVDVQTNTVVAPAANPPAIISFTCRGTP